MFSYRADQPSDGGTRVAAVERTKARAEWRELDAGFGSPVIHIQAWSAVFY